MDIGSKIGLERTSMKFPLSALLVSLLLAAPTAAQVYVEGDVGAAFTSLPSSKLRAQVPVALNPRRPPDEAVSTSFDPVIAGGLAVGYRFTRHLRFEARANAQYDVVQELRTLGYVNDDAARLTTVSPMANFFFDYPVGDSRFTPYVGIGAGATWARLITRSETLPVIDDSDVAFAVNVLGGVALRLFDGVSATLNYRYLRTLSTLSYDAAVPVLFRYDTVKLEIQSHVLAVGLRYDFGYRAR